MDTPTPRHRPPAGRCSVWADTEHTSRVITPDIIAIAHAPAPTELLMFAGFSGERSASISIRSSGRVRVAPPERCRCPKMIVSTRVFISAWIIGLIWLPIRRHRGPSLSTVARLLEYPLCGSPNGWRDVDAGIGPSDWSRLGLAIIDRLHCRDTERVHTQLPPICIKAHPTRRARCTRSGGHRYR